MNNRFLNFEEYAVYEMTKSDLLKGAKGSRSKSSQTVIAKFNGAKFVDDVLEVYFTASDKASKAGKEWEEIIQVLEFSKDAIDKKSLRKALQGNLKVYCDCPDYQFAGFAYIGTKKEYSIYDELRPPDIRNPQQQGTVCKHLIAVLRSLDSNIGAILQDLICLACQSHSISEIVAPHHLPPLG
jgi:hypothetical protein